MDAIRQNVDTAAIENDSGGKLYWLSVGSGGFKASHESIDIVRRPDSDEGEYVVRFLTPVSVSDLHHVDELEDAVRLSHQEAEKRLLNPTMARAPDRIPDIPSELKQRF